MSLLRRLETKLRPYAVSNLTTYLIAGQVLVYVFDLVQRGQGQQGVLELIWLRPDQIMVGEVWRVVTFLFQPPVTHPIFLIFYWLLMYLFGTTLEQHWGPLRFNLYLIIGWVATVAAAMGLYFSGVPVLATNTYLYTSLFLAFAHLYPDFELRVYLLIPVKVKWLALLTWLWLGLSVYGGGWPQFWIAAATVADYLLFFGASIWNRLKHKWRGHRFQQRVQAGQRAHAGLVHRCRVCGLSSDDSPRTQFRYCSKCDGDCCYCPEHLQDHEHVQRAADTATREEAVRE